jgi:hypothetical protein
MYMAKILSSYCIMTIKFSYKNVQHHSVGHRKTVRSVVIRNGKGYKKVAVYHRGKRRKTVRRQLAKDHIDDIQQGRFIRGLFDDCK